MVLIGPKLAEIWMSKINFQPPAQAPPPTSGVEFAFQHPLEIQHIILQLPKQLGAVSVSYPQISLSHLFLMSIGIAEHFMSLSNSNTAISFHSSFYCLLLQSFRLICLALQGSHRTRPHPNKRRKEIQQRGFSASYVLSSMKKSTKGATPTTETREACTHTP